ncbi:MAG: hypothetical protein ACTSV5_04695, partial [Promethearchaeota archaeon]
GSLGYGGNIIGRVFEMLLMQTLTNFSNKEVIPGVYVLSAFSEKTFNGTKNYGVMGSSEYYLPPSEYNQSEVKDANKGFAYCEVKKEGMADYELTIGAGVTLLIYDQDKSFIRAVEKILSFFDRFMNYDFETETVPEELISEGVEVLTWFLIHINDIFTGEELFAINPITWQSMKIIPKDGFDVTKTWKVTGTNNKIEEGDEFLSTVPGGDTMLDRWNGSAGDSYMQWLLQPTDNASLVDTMWTSFTFDLIQLWVKNFEIHIDAAEIINMIGGLSTSQVDIASIFQGLDIEFYLFTHHLAGAFLYNDSNSDGMLSTEYETLPVTIDDVPVEVPRSSEVTHRIVLGTVDEFDFEMPHKTGENKISWGLKMENVVITPVPVGVDLESYLGAANETLGYIHFGFSFQPREVAPGVLAAPIKLDQFFSPWNSETGNAKNDITNLDLAIIYLSTMLHFHLNVAVLGEDPEDPTSVLDPTDDYDDQTHSLKVGNYLGGAFGGNELEFVDIAGPDYEYGSESTRLTAPATSSIIPLALYNGEIERHDTFVDDSGMHFETFATDIALNVSFNVLAYAVCFPEFEDGNGIWHDPTFSVYMVFEAQGFWALILLIAGIGLVGIGTILIKRRKDARF